MNTFLLVTKLELRKLNATTALKLSVISGLFVPLLYLIYYLLVFTFVISYSILYIFKSGSWFAHLITQHNGTPPPRTVVFKGGGM